MVLVLIGAFYEDFRLRNPFAFRASDNASSLRNIGRANVDVYATSGQSLPKRASFSGEPNFPGHRNLTLTRIGVFLTRNPQRKHFIDLGQAHEVIFTSLVLGDILIFYGDTLSASLSSPAYSFGAVLMLA